MRPLSIAEQIIPFLCLGIVAPGVPIAVSAFYKFRTKNFLSIFYLMFASTLYLVCGGGALIAGPVLKKFEIAVQIVRLGELILLGFTGAIPYFLRTNLSLGPRQVSINRIIIWIGIMFAGIVTVIAIVRPDLYISVTEQSAGLNDMWLEFVRGKEGPLLFVRDFYLLFVSLYAIATIIASKFWKGDNVISIAVFIGFLLAILFSAQAFSEQYFGGLVGPFKVLRYQRFEVGLTLFVFFSYWGVLRTFFYKAREGEAHRNALIESQAKLSYLAYHDSLTGIKNRRTFLEDVEREINAVKKNPQRKSAIIVLDIAGFYDVNASYGHAIGDQTLIELVKTFKGIFQRGESIYRTEGDEFAVIIPDIQNRFVAEREAKLLHSMLRIGLNLDGNLYYLSSNVGGVVLPDDGMTIDEVYENLYHSLKVAKQKKNSVQFHSEEIKDSSNHRLSLVKAMREGILRKEFQVVYQPIHTLSGAVWGGEALLRWLPSSRVNVSPDVFIPIAESSGLMTEIGHYVIDQVIDDVVELREKKKDVAVSVNLSPIQFLDTHFTSNLLETLWANDVGPDNIAFEITENSLVENIQNGVSSLEKIRDNGFSIALDDFGTGYSSLGYLHSLPVDKLKIDKSFIRKIPGSSNSEALIRTIMELSREFGYDVVAEGIENEQQLEFMKYNGCQRFQGFLFNRPLEFEDFLKSI